MLGVFVDSGDLYHRIKRKFSKKLSYENYKEAIEQVIEPNKHPLKSVLINQFVVYSTKETNNISFLHYLRTLGIQIKRKRARTLKNNIKICDWGVQLTLDVVDFVKKCESHLDTNNLNEQGTIILGISNLDYIPLIKWLQEKGIKVIVFACSIPDRIKEICDCTEIEETLCN